MSNVNIATYIVIRKFTRSGMIMWFCLKLNSSNYMLRTSKITSQVVTKRKRDNLFLKNTFSHISNRQISQTGFINEPSDQLVCSVWLSCSCQSRILKFSVPTYSSNQCNRTWIQKGIRRYGLSSSVMKLLQRDGHRERAPGTLWANCLYAAFVSKN